MGPAKYMSEIDPEKDKQEEYLMDALGHEQECVHEPHQLNHLGSDEGGEEIAHYYQCECGKEIKDLFRLSKRTEY
jgi:hypothetical protein